MTVIANITAIRFPRHPLLKGTVEIHRLPIGEATRRRTGVMVSLRNTTNAAPEVPILHLAEFRVHAEGGSAVAVVRDRTTIKVIAVAASPTGRSVAWLRSSEDTTAHFVSSLGNAFGKRIAEHTARELKLTSRGGIPLTASVVQQAIRMAESAKASLEGVAFMETLCAGHRLEPRRDG